MRAILAACLVTLLLGAGGYFLLAALQQTTGAAYTMRNARTDPSWYWRTVSAAPSSLPCQPRRLWQWFFVDMRSPAGEPRLCAASQ